MSLNPVAVRAHHPLAGIGFAVAAGLVLTLQDALVKWLTRDFSVLQILFVRSVVMTVPVLALLLYRHGAAGLRTRRPFGHLLRLTLNLVAFVLFFFALSRLPLADVTALMMTAPLFMALLSGPLLGEPARGPVWLATGCGFAGVLLMVGPHGGNIDTAGVIAVVAAAALYALWMIVTRHLSAGEHSATLVLYSAVGIALLTALTLPWQWRPVPDAAGALLLGSVGLLSATGHLLMVQAYRYAPVYVVGPFDYLALVWALLLGYLVWRELPTPAALSGAALIVMCGLWLFRLQRRANGRGANGAGK